MRTSLNIENNVISSYEHFIIINEYQSTSLASWINLPGNLVLSSRFMMKYSVSLIKIEISSQIFRKIHNPIPVIMCKRTIRVESACELRVQRPKKFCGPNLWPNLTSREWVGPGGP